MAKNQFVSEFEFRASRKMLYPYISTASGLAQWYADDVNIDDDKNYSFIIDGEIWKADMVSSRVNSFVKFEFIPDEDEDEDEANTVEIRLEKNEMTNTTFIKITEVTDIDDNEELQGIWENLVGFLKEIVGG